MCVVSNMGDEFTRRWPMPVSPWPHTPMSPWPGLPKTLPQEPYRGPTREQFEEFLELFRAAKKIDVYLGTPDCELDEKLATLRAHAKRLGLDPSVVS